MFLALISVCAVLVTFIKLYFLMKSVSTIIFGIPNQKEEALAGPSGRVGCVCDTSPANALSPK